MVAVEDREPRIFGLTKLEGETFINEAYALLLNRQPDSEGFIYYMDRLRRGISKRKIISQLLKSPEVASRQEIDPEFNLEVLCWKKFSKNLYKNFILNTKSLFETKNNNKQLNQIYTSKDSSGIERINEVVNSISHHQSILNEQINSLKLTVSDSNKENFVDIRFDAEMTRQARYIYNLLTQPMPASRPDTEIPCE
ncbi:DUF4214 domain-containing protein [Sphingobium sp. TB-6]|uniref:DUF4214 domain-containing protein n=1 Tax=Sphingobium sp. TB-6 TaxID=2728850 RepID=UPI00146F75CA|nr:DUF4214 domain-containing protein [Sphingobium sp. TB-6]NML88104.1 DUF4214 domain-containing protein [Sphingobium sp. TB-6]